MDDKKMAAVERVLASVLRTAQQRGLDTADLFGTLLRAQTPHRFARTLPGLDLHRIFSSQTASSQRPAKDGTTIWG
jgi:hypothetical protein